MHLRCSLLNAQGLVTKRTNKIKTEEFQSIFNSSDLVLLVETWTNEFSDIYLRNKETQQSIQFIVRIPCNVNRQPK